MYGSNEMGTQPSMRELMLARIKSGQSQMADERREREKAEQQTRKQEHQAKVGGTLATGLQGAVMGAQMGGPYGALIGGVAGLALGGLMGKMGGSQAQSTAIQAAPAIAGGLQQRKRSDYMDALMARQPAMQQRAGMGQQPQPQQASFGYDPMAASSNQPPAGFI